MAGLEEPDKGYAWVVLLGACIINMILSGMARMIGLLYVAIIDAYGVTRKEASVPFSVRNAVRYMAGKSSLFFFIFFLVKDYKF